MGLFLDLIGTLSSYLQIGKGGVRIKNNSGNLQVKRADGTTDATVQASQLLNSGDSIILNSDAAESGADFKMTLARPASGMSANVTITLPVDDGTANQVLQTDGSGNLSWTSAASTEACDKVDTTTLAYDATSPVSMFNLPVNAIITKIQVIVDTIFNGTNPTLSIGVTGTASKYMASTQNDLTVAATYEVNPGIEADENTEALIATFNADSSSAGSARILVFYTTPA